MNRRGKRRHGRSWLTPISPASVTHSSSGSAPAVAARARSDVSVLCPCFDSRGPREIVLQAFVCARRPDAVLGPGGGDGPPDGLSASEPTSLLTALLPSRKRRNAPTTV